MIYFRQKNKEIQYEAVIYFRVETQSTLGTLTYVDRADARNKIQLSRRSLDEALPADHLLYRRYNIHFCLHVPFYLDLIQ